MKKGFSLIELITIMAIIAILCAIGLAVFPRARLAALRSNDIQNLNELRTATQLYAADQGGYPPQLLGYATMYNGSGVVPADRLRSYLSPSRMGLDSLNSRRNEASKSDITTAVWPQQDPSPIGERPMLDLTGDGVINAWDDTSQSRQAFGPTDGCYATESTVDQLCGNSSALFYSVNGYGIARNPFAHPSGGAFPQYELRYALFWTAAGTSGAGGSNDDPRQLGYRYPPDETIITWNTWWREWETAILRPGVEMAPTRGSKDILLTVGGTAVNRDSRAMFVRSWRH